MLRKSLNTRYRFPKYEGVNIESALVRVRNLQISDVPPDMVLGRSRVSAHDIQQHPSMAKSLPTIISLHDADHLRRGATSISQPSDAQTCL